MQAFVVVPVDPFEDDLDHVGFGLQRAGAERRVLGHGLVLEQAITVSAAALSYASPTLPMDGSSPSISRVSV